MSPQVSLVVCTVGRIDPLARLLTTLRRQEACGFEVILVDQNPRGHLDRIIAEFGDVPIVHLYSARGLSRARNVGLPHCRGSIVGFPDDDCWYGPRVLANVKSFFAAHPQFDFLTGRTLDDQGRESVSRLSRRSGTITRANVFLAGNSATLFVRRDLAQAIAFDETLGVGADTPFQSGEETDFLLRCLERGHRGYFDRSHTIFHDQVSVPVERARAYSLGFGRVVRNHNLGPLFFAARSSRTLLGSCYRLLRGDVDGARQRYAWLTGSIRGYAAMPGKPSPRRVGS